MHMEWSMNWMMTWGTTTWRQTSSEPISLFCLVPTVLPYHVWRLLHIILTKVRDSTSLHVSGLQSHITGTTSFSSQGSSMSSCIISLPFIDSRSHISFRIISHTVTSRKVIMLPQESGSTATLEVLRSDTGRMLLRGWETVILWLRIIRMHVLHMIL